MYTQPVFGNYIGIVVADEDPEDRNRIQVWVPHISVGLYDGWNAAAQDVTITRDLGSLPVSIDKLKRLLPWAEPAAPVFGNGGTLRYNDTNKGSHFKTVTPTLSPPNSNNSNDSVNRYLPWTSGNNSKFSTANSKTEGPDINVNGRTASQKDVQTWLADYRLKDSVLLTTEFPAAQLKTYGLGDGNSTTQSDPAVWANFFGKMVEYESGYRLSSTAPPGEDSVGLLQVSLANAREYGYNNSTVQRQDLVDNPKLNLDVGINLFEQSAAKYGSLVNGKGIGAPIKSRDQTADSNGIGGSFAALTMNKIAADAAKSNTAWSPRIITDDPTIISSQTGKVVKKGPDTTAGHNISDTDIRTPQGQFSTPAVGNLVWVFFYGGDVQKPVYFASVAEPNASGRIEPGGESRPSFNASQTSVTSFVPTNSTPVVTKTKSLTDNGENTVDLSVFGNDQKSDLPTFQNLTDKDKQNIFKGGSNGLFALNKEGTEMGYLDPESGYVITLSPEQLKELTQLNNGILPITDISGKPQTIKLAK